MSNNESYEILKFGLEHFDKEGKNNNHNNNNNNNNNNNTFNIFETHIESLRNESKMLSELLKKNLQSELLNLPNSIRKMSMEEFLQHCLDIDAINVTSVPTLINNKDNNSETEQQQQQQQNGNNGLSLTELLFSPEKSVNEIDNSNSNTSIDSESMNNIKQKVIDILNSPQLILKKKGFNSNNNL
ncbi:hypothetical protein DDB_G0285671 [Dictyostelium discoideum AX4]|uniref:Putative uncharacterized protein DDB_G0285671 n=1 Tax=Dictyostelium discoideum TaxID=44689 RepID=Y6650_DICDI|nr:hypothetical protein DDB_G0285671 [Dictyostelium discoideum AX4]Q54MT6.1 RecName: Full=Putative uncharacterized protein DDB_G0285671 [Dictyostelium discoideum]EAL64673.1 hypothetical protein DDB_G0285671 [Dictyostelium discoideum AX4]|eukprot:XP_638207.1 hypothetical protein DDB_G0285671 [Dictyostelium discoideum AX4]